MDTYTEVNFEEIIKMFAPKINKCLRNTPLQERENLEQEIKIKIYEKMPILQNMPAPNFFDFIEKN
ncbi:hypothetical protein OCA08_06150 [Bacillus cereus]|uniref:hypothetical protein n=1 Tax=unclassified Bacillus cereus group TaxID=2750818 RepID=UPI003F7A7C69|nr:hypothetical protein [Bacillus cereus]